MPLTAQVLEIVEVFAPHLIIFDLQMPKLDGYATAAGIEANTNTTTNSDYCSHRGPHTDCAG
jgi:CheY-like chemotaxis protein